MRAWSAGFDIAAGLMAGGFIGWLIDQWTGHAPYWMLGMGLAGLFSGGYRFVREAMAINRDAAARFRSGTRTPEKPIDPVDKPDP